MRQPSQPPFGPLTLEQAQLSQEIEKSENSEKYSEALLKIVIDFVTQNYEDNIDDSIVKLKAVKKVLDSDSELLIWPRTPKKQYDYDNYYQDEYELPPHFYGEEGEILFFDDE